MHTISTNGNDNGGGLETWTCLGPQICMFFFSFFFLSYFTNNLYLDTLHGVVRAITTRIMAGKGKTPTQTDAGTMNREERGGRKTGQGKRMTGRGLETCLSRALLSKFFSYLL